MSPSLGPCPRCGAEARRVSGLPCCDRCGPLSERSFSRETDDGSRESVFGGTRRRPVGSGEDRGALPEDDWLDDPLLGDDGGYDD